MMKNLTGLLSLGRRHSSDSSARDSAPPQTCPAAELAEYWPNDGWRKVAPEELGLDTKKVAALERELRRERRIIGACVVRRGYLALEYFRDGADDLQMIYSVTKSVVSMLVGIAIGQGKLVGVDQPLTSLFPELSAPNVDPLLKKITLRHLLTMSSGVEPRNQVQNTYQTWGEYVAAQKPVGEPGKTFRYSAFDAHLLAVILQQVTGEDLLHYARANLFGPLGISEVAWPMDNTGVRVGSHGMMLRTLDMAKLGHLLLSHGRWSGVQVIPEEWVAESTSAQMVQSDRLSRYGFLWWLHAKAKWDARETKADNFWAFGAAGQYLYVAPGEELVAVITSFLPEEPNLPMDIINRFIMPSVRE